MRGQGGTIWRALGTRIVLAAIVSVPFLTISGAAAQEPSGAQVRFHGPAAECPGEASVRREIEALLGRPLASVPAMSVDAEASQSDGRWVLRLRAGDLGERDIAGESCAALAQAAALMIAWMIDPAAETVVPAVTLAAPDRSPPVEQTPTPGALDLDSPEPLASPAIASRIPRASRARTLADPADVPAPRAPISVGLGPSFVLDVGSLPSVTIGVGGEVVVRIDRLDLRVRGHWLAPQDAAVPANVEGAPAGAGVVTELAGGSVHACGRPLEPGAPALAICGGIAVGAIVGRSHDVSSPASSAGVLAGLVIGAALPWSPIPELDLEVAAELAIQPVAPTFEIGGLGDVFTPAPVSGRLVITGHVDVR